MNLNEAYSILELPEDSDEGTVKKKFRELSKKWHPDKNLNNPDAERKFKEINSAYQRIVSPSDREKYEDSPQQHIPDFDFGFGGFGNPFQRARHAPQIQINTTISFEESILGCKKDIKYSRNIKCATCKGQGSIKLNTDCKKCGGKGHVVSGNGGMMYIHQCECAARLSSKKCVACKDGVISSESSVSVQIPGGVSNENVLRLSGMGNFVGSLGHMDQYTDTFVTLNVQEEKELRLENGIVFSDLNISLLEALKGTTKIVKTVLGDKEIKINPLSKNKEEVIIPHVGVNRQGDQKVILNVNYPDNVESLIKSLE